ncbi:MAG TPA: 2-dehydropantoate 2-reductase [Candidatus Cybelea sp.]|jgi:2-dehydropantoate 2-reductase
MRLLVVGAGAVGGYFGGRLEQAGRDVTFFARPQRAAQLRERGLEIVSPNGNATLHPKVVTRDELSQPYDLVLLTVKNYALQGALEDIAPAVGADTLILPTLNGMRHLDELKAKFGEAHVLGGVCIVATTLDAQGRIVQLTGTQKLVYGELDGSHSERIEQVDRTLQGAGFDARVSSDILLEMWEKFVFIAALGGITCLLRGTIGEITAAPGGRQLALTMHGECVAVATASGFAPRPEAIESSRATLTEAGSPLASSMYRDLQKGAALEADAILGDMCRRGEAAGLKLPLLSAAFAQLSIYEAQRKPASP